MVWTAIMVGLVGSLHCAGMCSPLAAAVTDPRSPSWRKRLLYNLGRILTYGLLGGIVAGAGVAVPFARFQVLISIVLGVLLVLMGIGGLRTFQVPILTQALQKLSLWLKNWFGYILHQKSYGFIFTLGMLNGLVPCGLTYLALAYCLTLAGVLDGFNFMVLFGLGTLPSMIGFAHVIQGLANRFSLRIAKVHATVMIVAGLLLVVRAVGFNENEWILNQGEKQSQEVVCK